MSLILSLETSAVSCSVALSTVGETICTKASEGEWRHSKEITLLIQACLDSSKKKLGDLAAIAISSGPGSYTGLRVAASCAKGMCYALDLPLLAIPTLEVIAFPFADKADQSTFIVPLIDARRDEVYYNVYGQNLVAQQTTTNLILEKDSFEQFEGQNLIFCGDGAEKASKLVNFKLAEYYPTLATAEAMSTLAFTRFSAKSYEDLAYYVPFYLKPPNITKSKKSLF